jgi:hypothetical protein
LYHRTVAKKQHGSVTKTDKKANGIEEMVEINLYNYSQLIVNKGAKNVSWKKESLFKKCWEN